MNHQTIEQMVEWLEILRDNVAMSPTTLENPSDDCPMLDAIRAALTARGLPEDRNRLPLEEIPEGIQFKSMIKSGKHDGYNVMLSGVRNGRICFFDGDAATPAEALRAAIAAAKDGAP